MLQKYENTLFMFQDYEKKCTIYVAGMYRLSRVCATLSTGLCLCAAIGTITKTFVSRNVRMRDVGIACTFAGQDSFFFQLYTPCNINSALSFIRRLRAGVGKCGSGREEGQSCSLTSLFQLTDCGNEFRSWSL